MKRQFTDGRKVDVVAAFRERCSGKDPATGCIEWLGATIKKRGGYGAFTHRPSGLSMARAHRIAWQLFCFNIEEDEHVLHSCDNPRCVNTDHLFLGDQAINVADMVAKGRQASGEQHGMYLRGRYVGAH